MSSPVVAIDGPAGSGKSTTARAVASRLGLAHLDSGALYRAVTLAALEAGVPLDGEEAVRAAEAAGVELRFDGERFTPFLGERSVAEAIRSEPVTNAVSTVSAQPTVRSWVTKRLRAAVLTHPRGAVADGRDIGTVVFPDARLKVFLTASIQERARRRALEQGEPGAVGRLAEAMAARDDADATREASPLRAAPDALHLDTTGLAFEEQVARVAERAEPLFPAVDPTP